MDFLSASSFSFSNEAAIHSFDAAGYRFFWISNPRFPFNPAYIDLQTGRKLKK
jgi:hypothetical protein